MTEPDLQTRLRRVVGIIKETPRNEPDGTAIVSESAMQAISELLLEAAQVIENNALFNNVGV